MEISTTLYHTARDRQIYKVDLFRGICPPVTTTVTSNPDIISAWIEQAITDLNNSYDPRVVGVGVQWRPYTGTTPAATLQLAVGEETCLIVQLAHCRRVPAALRDFLRGPYLFLGIWNHSDAWRLERCHHRLEFGERPPLDLRLHAFTLDRGGRKIMHSRESFETIVAECLDWYDVRVDRAISMSNWEKRTLSVAQVQQATVDAYASRSMGKIYYRFILESIDYRFLRDESDDESDD